MMVALNKMLQNSVQNFKLWCVIDQNNLEFALYHCVCAYVFKLEYTLGNHI